MKRRIFIIISLIILITLIGILTLARYKSNSLLDYFVGTKNFYLESDSLDTFEKENVNYMWNLESISFILKNYDNNDLVTSDNIKYSVTCQTNDLDIKCNLNDTNSNSITSIINGLEKKDVIISFNLESDKDIKDVEVYITVKSIEPYEKVLKGKYVLHKYDTLENNIEYSIINNKVYSNLVIKNNYDEDKCLDISINNDNIKLLKEDYMFDIKTNNNDYINSFKLNIGSKSNFEIKLFNEEDSEITKNNITVIECQ